MIVESKKKSDEENRENGEEKSLMDCLVNEFNKIKNFIDDPNNKKIIIIFFILLLILVIIKSYSISLSQKELLKVNSIKYNLTDIIHQGGNTDGNGENKIQNKMLNETKSKEDKRQSKEDKRQSKEDKKQMKEEKKKMKKDKKMELKEKRNQKKQEFRNRKPQMFPMFNKMIDNLKFHLVRIGYTVGFILLMFLALLSPIIMYCALLYTVIKFMLSYLSGMDISK